MPECGSLLDRIPWQHEPDVIVFGGSLVEMVVQVPQLPGPHQANVRLGTMNTLPGGSGANVAVYVARWGRRARLVDRWGDDEHGRFLQAGLQAEGVDLTYSQVRHGSPSAFMIILTLPDGDWSGIVRLPPELSLRADELTAESIGAGKFLHFHGFCMYTAPDQEAVQRAIEIARRTGSLISMDASTPLAVEQPEVLRRFFPQCDIVFANRIEAQAVAGIAEPSEAARRLIEWGSQIAVVKVGPEGCFAATPQGIAHVPAYTVPVVDTIGAGDGLVAGTLAGLSLRQPLGEAVRLGAAVAALACQGMGALSRGFHLDEALKLAGGEVTRTLDAEPAARREDSRS